MLGWVLTIINRVTDLRTCKYKLKKNVVNYGSELCQQNYRLNLLENHSCADFKCTVQQYS